MRRLLLASCAALLLALPVSIRAAQPAAYVEVGPPAALGAVAFATDGTVYGTVAALASAPHSQFQPYTLPDTDPALWQSTDHGHTWNARYHAPQGTRLVVLAASAAGSGLAYASVGPEGGPVTIERIDVGRGTATTLPLGTLLGVDRAGTAYGLRTGAPATLVRCRPDAAACDELPAPPFAAHAVVDPGSTGLLAADASATLPSAPIQVSTDGGASWAARATPAYGCTCHISFGGPAPATLYELTGPQWFSVSHDGALTWSTPIRAPENLGVVAGSHPSALFPVASDYPLSPVAVTNDDGATFRTLDLPTDGPLLGIDPLDPAHLFLLQLGRATQSWDGGHTWANVSDARFGTVAIDPARAYGVGAFIYAAIGDSRSGESIWASDDRGATWHEQPLLPGERAFGIFVSRDDPHTAYVTVGASSLPSGFRRTRDGGRTWQAVQGPQAGELAHVLAGDPLHLYSGGQVSGQESFDGGDTWSVVPGNRICAEVRAEADSTSPTGLRLHCVLPYPDVGPTVFGPRPIPIAPGLVGSPDGFFSLVAGDLLGDVQADGTWRSVLAPTGGVGPGAETGLAQAAWPARDGTVFYAIERDPRSSWVRRGSGRWWRLRHGAADLVVVAPLDATHVLAAPLNARSGYPLFGKAPLAVLDLTRPDVSPPAIAAVDAGLECTVPWTSAEAQVAGIVWRRGGAILQGATGPRRAPSRLDRGRALTCSVTAATTFGSMSLPSAPYRVAGTRIALPRPHVSGSPSVGARLRCSARTHVTWYRGVVRVARAHAGTYVVRMGDAGHAMACQTRLADGTVTRSRAVRVAGAPA